MVKLVVNGLGVAEYRAAAIAADDEGYRAMDVATPQCKELIASVIYLLSRAIRFQHWRWHGASI